MKKGFTIIELLAVIVILAIISTITAFLVGETISNSSTKLSQIQIQNIEQAAKTYYLKEGINEFDYDSTRGSDCVNIDYLVEKGYVDNQIIDPNNDEEVEGSVLIKYESNKYKYEYQENICTYYDKGYTCKLINDTDSSDSITAGDKYECKVDPDKEPYTFYILTTPKEDFETINLIMDQNINSDGTPAGMTGTPQSENATKYSLLAWNASDNNTEGPITAMQFLYEATKDWINIDPINCIYNDKEIQGTTLENASYTSFVSENGVATILSLLGTGVTIGNKTQPLRARMPIYSTDATKTEITKKNDLNEYLYTNFGYWTLSSYPDSPLFSYYVLPDFVSYTSVGSSNDRGVRPVITIKKNKLTS